MSRAAGYGMDAIRVDGNDIFAVYNATKAARESCLKNNRWGSPPSLYNHLSLPSSAQTHPD